MGQAFFTNRYEQLGWKFKDFEIRPSIRINVTNASGKNLEGRLNSSGVHLEKIPFLEAGYWVCKSRVSVGATAEYLLGLYSIQEAAAQLPAAWPECLQAAEGRMGRNRRLAPSSSAWTSSCR